MRRLAVATLVAVAATAGLGPAVADDRVVNVYNWSDYIAEDTIQKFEEKTGIKVVYDVFDSNEVLEAKLLSGSSGYDVVVPSAEFMARQIGAGIYQPLNKEALTNFGNLDPAILALLARMDPDNTYGLPYMEYTTGIGYNVDKVKERIGEDKIGSWDMIFDPETVAKLQDCGVAILDSPTDLYPAARNYLGLEADSKDSGDLEKATELLKSIRPYVRYFHSSQYINDLANGDICVAVGYSGDVLQARDRAAEAGQGVTVAYAVPREGALVGFDMLGVPSDAPHPEEAWAFINFILEPEIAADITNYVYFANPNTEATQHVDEEVRNDPGIYPSAEVREKLFTTTPDPQRYTRKQTRAWTSIKTGQ